MPDVPGHRIVGDVGSKTDIHPVAMQVTGGLGGLDVLINNASSLGPVPLALLADTECEALEESLAVNLVGPFRLTRALLGALGASAREGRGAVVLDGVEHPLDIGDLFVVPSWISWSLQAETQFDLFRFSDAPIMERLGFARTLREGDAR